MSYSHALANITGAACWANSLAQVIISAREIVDLALSRAHHDEHATQTRARIWIHLIARAIHRADSVPHADLSSPQDATTARFIAEMNTILSASDRFAALAGACARAEDVPPIACQAIADYVAGHPFAGFELLIALFIHRARTSARNPALCLQTQSSASATEIDELISILARETGDPRTAQLAQIEQKTYLHALAERSAGATQSIVTSIMVPRVGDNDPISFETRAIIGAAKTAPAEIIATINRFSKYAFIGANLVLARDAIPEIMMLPTRVNGASAISPYALLAIACHSGGLSGGHYIALARRHYNGPNATWFEYNDSAPPAKCESIARANVIVSLLLYAQVDDADDCIDELYLRANAARVANESAFAPAIPSPPPSARARAAPPPPARIETVRVGGQYITREAIGKVVALADRYGIIREHTS